MPRDLIDEVAEAIEKHLEDNVEADDLWRVQIASVLRERFEVRHVFPDTFTAVVGEPMPHVTILYPRSPAPVSVEDAARVNRAEAAVCGVKNVAQTIRDAADDIDSACNRAVAALKEAR